jgi:hypothetical protein
MLRMDRNAIRELHEDVPESPPEKSSHTAAGKHRHLETGSLGLPRLSHTR